MFTKYISSLNELIKDITENVGELSYIDAEQVAIGLKRARESAVEEVWAEITGIEDEYNGTIQRREGRIEKYFAPKTLLINGIPIKYVVDFYVPVFLGLNFKEKLTTVFHELYHISPKFDGNLRFFKGKGYKHGPSLEKYDKYMEYLVDKYLKLNPSATEFLSKCDNELNELCQKGSLPKFPKPEPELFKIIWC
jgi:hypothetical protein